MYICRDALFDAATIRNPIVFVTRVTDLAKDGPGSHASRLLNVCAQDHRTRLATMARKTRYCFQITLRSPSSILQRLFRFAPFAVESILFVQWSGADRGG